jgi:hypothetical protein
MDNNLSSSESIMWFKPVQFLGMPTIRPSIIAGKKGAVIQFIIPELKIGDSEIAKFEKLAMICDDSVEEIQFKVVTNKQNNYPGTLVSISFHYVQPSEEEPPNNISERIGRLIAGRFISLLSFAVGERLLAIHQQVNEIEDNGSGSIILRPQTKISNEPHKIEIPESLIGKHINDNVFKVLFWLRRGLSESDHLNAYSALMVSLEILASILIPPETTIKKCPNCGTEVGKLTRSSVKKLIVQNLGYNNKQFDRLWHIRNEIIAHGNKTVTADVINDVVEFKFDAIDLVYKGLKLAIGIPVGGPPHPHPSVMATDIFLGAE